MNPDHFHYIQQLLLEQTGILLETEKMYLAETKINLLAKTLGLSSVEKLMHQLQTQPHTSLLHQALIESLINHETTFFRDQATFESIQTHIIPDLIKKRAQTRHLRIWSAACSTGQEPYSLAMMICEHFPALLSWSVELIATDISSHAVQRAKEGRYSALEINRGLPKKLIEKYFDQHERNWQIKPRIRSMVKFSQLNLLMGLDARPEFDLIFLRNVFIYLDAKNRQSILDRLKLLLAPDGYLLLGKTESLRKADSGFEKVKFGTTDYYQKIRS